MQSSSISPPGIRPPEKKGYTGLANLGNTCFLNACIQVLNHTYEMTDILDSPIVKSYTNFSKIETEILKEWNELRASMWQQNGTGSLSHTGQATVVSPNKFVHNVHRIAHLKKKDIFTGWSQNDMPEFLLFMIECIHNSLARPVKIKISGKKENKTDELAIKCYEMLKNSYSCEYSEIMELFYGIYVSQISAIDGGCCDKIHTIKPENYFILDLPISTKPAANLYDCFDLFVKPEILIGENAWYNENTKIYENVKKQIVFWNFPKILIITLNRFSPDGTQKMEGHIDFPLENLDLSQYIKGYNASHYVYDLYAVCNHIGNIFMGHYTAIVKPNASNEWLHFNDQSVEKISDPASIVTPMAYCLFYRKKNKTL